MNLRRDDINLTCTLDWQTLHRMPAAAKIDQPQKIDVRKAVDIAMDYFRDFFPAASKLNMMLEEIEESPDGKRWLVTIGYDVISRGAFAFERGPLRSYKTITIDSATGRVVSVKIRSIA